MSRPFNKPGKRKIETEERPSRPLQNNPFAELDKIEALHSPVKPPLDVSSEVERVEQGRPPREEKIAPPEARESDSAAPPGYRGRLVLRREKKDRGGKTVVVITGFKEIEGFNAAKMADLAREVKNKLGCGGSFDRQEIVLQGDRCGAVADHLQSIGFKVDGVKTDGPG